MDDIHIKERQACVDCDRRLLNIVDGRCITCLAAKLSRVTEASAGMAQQYQQLIREKDQLGREVDRLRGLIGEAWWYVDHYGDSRKDWRYLARFQAAAKGEPEPDLDG